MALFYAPMVFSYPILMHLSCLFLFSREKQCASRLRCFMRQVRVVCGHTDGRAEKREKNNIQPSIQCRSIPLFVFTGSLASRRAATT